MKKIIVHYAEDFRENRKASKIYARLRDAGFDPTTVNEIYYVKTGEMTVEYSFNRNIDLPDKSRLEEMLKGLNLISLEVLAPEETLE